MAVSKDTPKGTENTSASQKTYEFDDLLELVGGFGRYTAFLYAFMCMLSVPTGAQNLIQVFYGATPDFQCVQHLSRDNNTCGLNQCCLNCSGYQFRDTFTSAVTEWNLVCDRSHLKAMTQAVYMAGLLVGSVAFSIISDKFGRRISVFVSILLLFVCGISSGFADCLSLFTLLRFFAGMANAGCLLARYVYCMELVTTKHRTAAGFLCNIFVSLGFTTLSLLAYLIRDWRYLMLAVTLPAAPLVFFWRFIPESPRWLIANNRFKEAHDILQHFAVKNGVPLDYDHLGYVIREAKRSELQKEIQKKPGLLDLVKTTKLRRRTIICTFNWFVNAVVFFGINLNVKNLGGDLYLNFFILCIIELPGALMCWYLLGRFGRRLPYCSFEIIGGVACMLVLAFPTTEAYRPVITTLAMIGRLCVGNNFMAVYVFTVELYPTVIRNVGLGVASMMARAGGILAPYFVLLADLPQIDRTLPLVIFGVLGIAAGLVALWLPETLFSPMPQTLEQVETWPEDYKIYCCQSLQQRMKHSNNDQDGEAELSMLHDA
ncbi:organic cation transporter protein-like [Actinia tenebrosa]|uniref:Organic cation transporter protein-like n=1 Tax=Actinia tenebrosa TaxID=6105 RepID=A0A6P8HRD3_ACTTE|nr:organic cation transporter protein-like [Actinia tenebrosa]